MNNTFLVREPVGRAWDDELLSFDATFSPGEQAGDAALALFADGKALPTQLTDVTLHADGTLASCRAWTRLSVAPDQALTLTLAPGTSAAYRDRLAVTPPKYIGLPWEISNGQLAIRVPASGIYPAADAPGPVLAMKFADGPWLGQGRVRASRDVIITTTFTHTGPLFVQWTTTLHYERVKLATFGCTFYAGDELVRIDETSSYDSDLTSVFNAAPGLAPDRMFTCGVKTHRGVSIRELDYARDETLAIVDFHSGHDQMGLSWIGLWRDGGEPLVGIVQLDSARWNHLSVNRVHLRCHPSTGAMAFETPLRGGTKVYALTCGRAADNITMETPTGQVNLAAIKTRYGALPLSKVLGWTLDWDASAEPQRPFLQSGADSIAQARARVGADPTLRRAYEDWARAIRGDFTPPPNVLNELSPMPVNWAVGGASGASGHATVWIALGDDEFARQAATKLHAEVKGLYDRVWTHGMIHSLIIFDGRVMKLWLQTYDVLHAGGFIDAHADRFLRRAFAFLAYCMNDPEFFPKQWNLADFNDPNNWYQGLGQTIGDAICPPNFETEYYTTFGMMGCCFRTHPQAAAWRRESAELLDRQLEVHYYDSGSYCESPNYHSHSLTMTHQLALSLRRVHGERDFFQHPRLRNQFEWFTRVQTPLVEPTRAGKGVYAYPWRYLDPCPEKVAMLAGQGNSAVNCSDMTLPCELAVAAAIYRDSDPAFSARCMTTWRRAGRPTSNSYNDLTFLLLADPSLPGCEKLDLRSELLTGTFAVNRGNPETPDEVMFLTKCGTATHHNDFDEGGFTIWAYGKSVAGDFGYNTRHEGRQVGCTATRNHNCVEFDNKNNGYLGVELTRPHESWTSGPLADLLVANLSANNLRDPDLPYWDMIPAEIEYRRFLLFVKPHYMFVFDSIPRCGSRVHKWWLHAESSAVHVDGARARFAGLYGVDLLAEFVSPVAPTIVPGEWSVMKHISTAQNKEADWRVLVAPLKAGQEIRVTQRLASGRVAMVEGNGPGVEGPYRDTILLAAFPFTYEDDSVAFHGRAGVVRHYANGHVAKQLIDGTRLDVR